MENKHLVQHRVISMPSMKGNSVPMMERIRECNIHIFCSSKVLGLKSIHISNKKTDLGPFLTPPLQPVVLGDTKAGPRGSSKCQRLQRWQAMQVGDGVDTVGAGTPLLMVVPPS